MISILIALIAANAEAHADRCDYLWVNNKVCAHWAWTASPAPDEDAEARVKLIDPANEKRDFSAYTIKVSIVMPSMGHGSAPVRVAPISGAPELFEVTRLSFFMGGAWEIRLDLVDRKTGQVLERVTKPYKAYEPVVIER